MACAASSASLAALGATTFSGAGSSAAAPVYQIWASRYAKDHDESLVYAAVGSGAGMDKIRKGEVDFGASDVIATKAELERDHLVMFPTVITGAVPVVNLPHVAPNAMRLTGDVLARIFLGEITHWDAPDIRVLNPGLNLTNLPIRLIVRADGSGTTYHFSDYLGRVSPAWKQRFEAATKVNWPVAASAVNGSAEVSKAVRATVGALGYIDYNYVLDDALCGVSMKNADGYFVTASADGFRAAVLNSAWFATGDFTSELSSAPGPTSWPITMGTYIAVPRVTTQSERTERALRFITWAYLHGDALAREAKFVPLPDKVQAGAYREIFRVSNSKGESLGAKVLNGLTR